MSTAITFNGVGYSVPSSLETNWASLSAYLIALASGTFQRAGGSFTLTADADFGANYGLVSIYFKSRTANISDAGIVRLANTDQITFRNGANSANLTVGIASDRLQFGGVNIPTISSTDTLTNKTFTSPTITGPIFSGLTASTVPYLDASKILVSSAVTPTELGYVSGVTSALQTQMNLKAPLASPTFTGTVIAPLVVGGTGTGSSLTLQSTSGVGATDSIIAKVGNNGAITALTISTAGAFTIGDTSTATNRHTINGGISVLSARSTFAANAEAYALGLKFSSGGSIFYLGPSSTAGNLQFSSAGGGAIGGITQAGQFSFGAANSGANYTGQVHRVNGGLQANNATAAGDGSGEFVIGTNVNYAGNTASNGRLTGAGNGGMGIMFNTRTSDNVDSLYFLSNKSTDLVGAVATKIAIANQQGDWTFGTVSTNIFSLYGQMRLNGSSSGYAGLKSPSTGPSITWTLPTADGTTGYALKTDGSGNLGWAAISTTPASNVTAGTVSYESAGTVSVYLRNASGSDLSAAQTMYWTRVGKLVTIVLPPVQALTTAPNLTISTTTGVFVSDAASNTWPAAITPARQQSFLYTGIQNGVYAVAACSLGSGGNLGKFAITLDPAGTAFGGTNWNKGVGLAVTLSYMMD